MEKLQKALSIARDQRNARTNSVASAARTVTPASSSTDELWAELKSVSPDSKILEKNRITATRASNKFSASFDILRTKVLLTMQKNGWRRLAITSPTASCGKTTIACNLALGFTRQTNVRVLLLEFDLRKPTMAAKLDLPQSGDVVDMLAGNSPFAEQAVRFGSNVAVSVARQPAADPTAVLLSNTTHQTLSDIEETYQPDVVIFDLPPLLINDDTRAFLKDVDCALMVARAGKSTIPQIDDCEREIAEYTNVMGLVLNQCQHDDNQYGQNSR